MTFLGQLALIAWVILCPLAAKADTFPSRHVTIVVPFAAGSGSDTAARILAQHLGPALNASVIVENKVGATGALAASAVARAAPDGHTLLLATNSTHGSNPSLFKNLPYDPVRDFAPIARIGIFTYFLVVYPGLPATSAKELVGYAKANPDKLSYAAGSSTSLIMAETFKQGTGISALKIPYRSNPPALTDLIAGRVSMMFVDISSAIGFVKAGTLRPLAITSRERSNILPDLPTIHEALLPDFAIESWTGVLAPAGTPDAIVQKLNGEIRKILDRPDVKQRMLELGVDLRPNTPEDFALYIRSEVQNWTTLVKAAGIEPE
jgi:tripartite-type tricarboxylate transporter receptor subunit TctC